MGDSPEACPYSVRRASAPMERPSQGASRDLPPQSPSVTALPEGAPSWGSRRKNSLPPQTPPLCKGRWLAVGVVAQHSATTFLQKFPPKETERAGGWISNVGTGVLDCPPRFVLGQSRGLSLRCEESRCSYRKPSASVKCCTWLDNLPRRFVRRTGTPTAKQGV